MINFTTLRFKNFLSSGNVFTEIKFDEHPTNLVVGKNGAGKSTMLDALCFVLFGKPFRNINKPQLVNSVNQKACVVEIEFVVGKRQYKIVRGIKPNLFEIYQDGVLIDQDAASKDYQKHLEENILKLNFKSFTQIVILGVASFTPFMELSAASRREIIEDILDIRIFTVMNNLLKEKVSDLKDALNTLEGDLNINIAKTKLQDNYIKSLQADRQQRIDELNQKIAEAEHDIREKDVHIKSFAEDRDRLLDILGDTSGLRLEIQEIHASIRDLEKEKKSLTSLAELSKNHTLCPVCVIHPDLLEVNAKIRDLNKEYNAIPTLTEKYINCPVCSTLPAILDLDATIRDLTRKETSANQAMALPEEYTACKSCSVLPEILEITATIRDLEKDKINITKTCGFYTDHTTCPTCQQDISEELRQDHVAESNKKIDDITTTIVELVARRKTLGETAHTEHQARVKREYDETVLGLTEAVVEREKLGSVSHQLHVNSVEQHRTDITQIIQVCNTERDKIGENLHRIHTEEVTLRHTTIDTSLEDLTTKLQEKKVVSDKVEKQEGEIALLTNKISSQNSEKLGLQRFMETLVKEKSELEKKGGNIEEEKAKLRTMASEVLTMTSKKAELKEEKDYHDVAVTLLKDGGVKTRIIKQYLPAINQMVNKYLHAMDFFVSFELNEQFSETIKSRHRDEFSYESFSQGEKQRIDLALVFTWRTIAKMKNSTSTNLLILDEVFDSSLDADGTDYVVNLLKVIGEQTNVWVISHKPDIMADKFSNVLHFVKKNNFSVLER